MNKKAKKRLSTQNRLLKISTEKLYKKFSVLDKQIKINQKKNSQLWDKMSMTFDVLGYKLKKEAEKLGFREGAKVRIKEVNELPRHLRNRRNKGLSWGNYNTTGVREISFIYANRNTGYPDIDSAPPELLINLHPPLQHKNTKGMALPLIIRLSDIELMKKSKK